MSRLHIVHTTSFAYGGPVTASYNEVRLTPLSEPRQKVLESVLDVQPLTWRHEYRDYWGTAVTAFESSVPHERLVITATARVEVMPSVSPRGLAGWERVTSREVHEPFAEFLAATRTTVVPDDVAALAGDAAATLEPDDAAREICSRLRSEVSYVPGATAVHSSAQDAWRARKGVCQDMAHLSVGALRSIGIPARYVSGYLHPLRVGHVGQVVTGESHAWIEWWAGRWVAFDPTNGTEVGEHHVVLARGREYNDVAPVRGIYAGSGTDALDVAVRITREA